MRGWSSDPRDRPNFREIVEVFQMAIEETPEVSALEGLDMMGGAGDALDGLM